MWKNVEKSKSQSHSGSSSPTSAGMNHQPALQLQRPTASPSSPIEETIRMVEGVKDQPLLPIYKEQLPADKAAIVVRIFLFVVFILLQVHRSELRS